MRIRKKGSGVGFDVLYSEKKAIRELSGVLSFSYDEDAQNVRMFSENGIELGNTKMSPSGFAWLKRKVMWSDRLSKIGYRTAFFGGLVLYLTIWFTGLVAVNAMTSVNCPDEVALSSLENEIAVKQQEIQQMMETIKSKEGLNMKSPIAPSAPRSDSGSAETWRP